MKRFEKNMTSTFVANTKVVIIAISCIVIFGCNDKNNMPEKIVNCKISRFDKDLFKTNVNSLDENALIELQGKYGEFYNSFIIDIIHANPENALNSQLLDFAVHPSIRKLYNEVDSVFPSLVDVESELSIALSRYSVEFPRAKIPHFVSFISEFGFANVAYDTIIGIGLDMYLGPKYALYPALEFPDYMIQRLQKSYIVPNTIKTLAISNFEATVKDKRFLAMMLFEGKVRYFMKVLMPDVSDTVLLGYTQKQLNWCNENEVEIWSHMLEKKVLFSTETPHYMRYLNDGPYTIAEGVPRESSPAIGVFTGYQIIKAYMKRHQEVSLKALMEDIKWDDILKESAYRPSK